MGKNRTNLKKFIPEAAIARLPAARTCGFMVRLRCEMSRPRTSAGQPKSTAAGIIFGPAAA